MSTPDSSISAPGHSFPNIRQSWHLVALAAVVVAIGILFLQEPGFGDDLTYWSFAFDLHEEGLNAWQKGSFHDLRWPVWAVCWVLQAIFGPGLLAYYGEPLIYLAGGSILAFIFGKKLTHSVAAAWACGLAFVFHPLLDTVCYRPMPDLSEGVWGAATMLGWWCLMQSKKRSQAFLYAVLTGASIFILEANRITGAFIVPVLIVCTLLFFPRRFGWLIVAGVVAATLYAGECYFYKRLFDDWLHDITANLRNKGAKGTEFPNVWSLPFRFFDTLWKGNPLAPVYCILTVAGIWTAWRRFGDLGRVIVVWFATLYLCYACAPQSLWPWRPLVRDADRFLCGLAVPMSVLTVLGLWFLGERLATASETSRFATKCARLGQGSRRQVLVGIAVIALLVAITSRSLFDIGFVPDMRRYLAGVPDGTKVFSHKSMREIVFLVDANAARRFTWFSPNKILHSTPELEAQAAQCSEFWYARKLVWLTTRKDLEKQRLVQQPALGSYFDTPERDWLLTGLFAKGETPDLTFYRRRQADSPTPHILGPDAAEWQHIIPSLPQQWTRGTHSNALQTTWNVPEKLRGRLARFELSAASDKVEALTIRLSFVSSGKTKPYAEYLLKPYLYTGGGKEFFALPIPAKADSCRVEFKFSKSTKSVRFTSFRAVIEGDLAGQP